MSYSDINRVVLVGRLTSDPELRALPSGAELCSLRVACNRSRKEADGSYSATPNFFSVSVFGTQAQSVDRYLHKGSRVAIDGRLQWSEWEAGDGSKRQTVQIVADRVEFLDSPLTQTPDGADRLGDPGEESGHPLVGVGAGIEDDISF